MFTMQTILWDTTQEGKPDSGIQHSTLVGGDKVAQVLVGAAVLLAFLDNNNKRNNNDIVSNGFSANKKTNLFYLVLILQRSWRNILKMLEPLN